MNVTSLIEEPFLSDHKIGRLETYGKVGNNACTNQCTLSLFYLACHAEGRDSSHGGSTKIPDFSEHSPVHPAVNGYLTLFRVGEAKAARERRWAPPSFCWPNETFTEISHPFPIFSLVLHLGQIFF